MKTNHTARRKRRTTGGYILALVAVLVLFGVVNSGRSLVQILRLSAMKTEERKAGNELERKKTRLQLEIFRLTTDSLYIEEIARKEYGMVKCGEEVFTISVPDTTNTTPRAPGRAGTPGKEAHVSGK